MFGNQLRDITFFDKKPIDTSAMLSNSQMIDYDLRKWIPDRNQQGEINILPSDIQFDKTLQRTTKEYIQMTPLKAQIQETNSCRAKKYRLSMWRLDKEQLTKVIVAQQTFTVWSNSLEIFRNRFCFSLDRKVIHLTLKEKNGQII